MSVSLLQSNLKVTGSTTIYSPNLSGIGGVAILRSGDFVLISGGVSSGGGGTTIITGSPTNISGLISTGQADLRYYPLLSNPSGYITSGQTGQFYSTSNLLGFATSGNLASTGQSAWLAAQNNAINLSGNLLLTGQRIWGDSNNNALNLSGNLLNMSGVLTSQIAGASAGVSTLNGFSGSIQVLPTGQNITIQSTGSKIYIGATGFITSGDLLNSISGFIQTGNADLRYYAISNPAQFVTTGNLYLTGSNLDGKINVLSGLLTATGALVLNISGGLDVRIRATGQAAWVSANGAAAGLSGNLQLTGQKNWLFGVSDSGNLISTGQILNGSILNLSGALNLSGRRAWDDATNLSGRLTNTGGLLISIIQNQSNSLSGWSDSIFVHRTGNESISGEKYFLNNVGIGTTAPAKKLHVLNGVGAGYPTLSVSDVVIVENGDNFNSVIQVLTNRNQVGGISFGDQDSRSMGSLTYTHGGDYLAMATSGVERLKINNIGNLGIGVGSLEPAAKVDISGDILIRGNVTGLAGQYDFAKTILNNYSILPTDYRIYCNNSNPIVITFSNVSLNSGQLLNIKLLNTGAVYFTGVFGQKFDGSDLYVAVGQYNTYSLHAFANNWNLW